MDWVIAGTVRDQRDKWVVRVDGLDTVAGSHKPKRLVRPASTVCPVGRQEHRTLEAGMASRLAAMSAPERA
jgi:hypothetical protein